MNPLTLPLADANAKLENVGGKGMSLAKLSRCGLPVPYGFHVATDAYRQFVARNDLQTRILSALKNVNLSEPTTLRDAQYFISRLFLNAKTPDDIVSAIVSGYRDLFDSADQFVAVRSSATAEDLPGASFAGQQETYLNVRGETALLDAVKKCWASLWTARAIAYRARQNIDPNAVALAVVVQELTLAEASGIMFTVNPINGNADEVVINASWGLGEAVVSGAVTPDVFVVSKRQVRVVQREISEKLTMTVRTEAGVSEQLVPESLRVKETLADAQAVELMQYGVQIERIYGVPMDIEWALAGGKFSVLQARPITSSLAGQLAGC